MTYLPGTRGFWKRGIVRLLGVLCLAVLTWLLWPNGGKTGPIPVPPTQIGERPHAAWPPLPGVVHSASPSVVPGPCSVRGRVMHNRSPVEATVEIRVLLRTNLDHRSLLLPPYSNEPVLASVRAGPDGTFLFTGLPANYFEVTGRSDSGARGWARALCSESRPQESVYLDLAGGGTSLEGRALWRDGSPFHGFAFAQVNPFSPARINLPQVRTDEEGRFLLPGLPEGKIALWFLVPKRFAVWTNDVEIPSSGVCDYVVDGETEEFSGTVIADDTEEPLVGASVEYRGESADRVRTIAGVTESDANGRFTYRLPRCGERFRVRMAGFAAAYVTKADGHELVIRMSRLATATGRVVKLADGSPVSGVAVFARGTGSTPMAVSDEVGQFALSFVAGARKVYAFGGGWVSVGIMGKGAGGKSASAVAYEAGTTTEIKLEVVPVASVEGVLRDRAGLPECGVPVFLQPASSRLRYWGPATKGAVTEADGSFRFDALVPGVPHRIVAEPVPGVPTRSERFSAKSGETIRIELVSSEERWLPVVVVEKESGAPIEGARVTATQPQFSPPVAMTGADGRAIVGPLAPGSATVKTHHSRYTRPSAFGSSSSPITIPHLSPNPEEVRIELPKGYFVRGRFRNSDGTPFSSGWIGLFRVGADPRSSFGLTGLRGIGEEGAFAVGPVPPGDYELVILSSSERDRKVLTRRQVSAGDETIEWTITPEEGGSEPAPMVFRVLGPEGRPASGGIAILRVEQREPAFAWLRNGCHEVIGAKPGTSIWIEIRKPSDPDDVPLSGVVAGPYEVGPGTVEIRLSSDDPIEGRVIGPDGRGVPGIAVGAMPVLPMGLSHIFSRFAMPSAKTQSDGRFRLTAAAVGQNSLVLDLPTRYAPVAPVVTGAGEKHVVVRLLPGVSCRIRVIDPAGKPAEGALVSAGFSGSPSTLRWARVDESGVADLAGLDPGAMYELTVIPPPGREDVTHLIFTDWRPVNEELALPQGQLVTGLVCDANGLVPNATVYWQDAREQWRELRSGTDGRFRLTVLAGSRVILVAAEPGFLRHLGGRPVTTRAGTREVRLSLK
jgi:hypothetical protein